jgi:NAD-dependent dihydropyrimidine dehydrogenase PreA subunit
MSQPMPTAASAARPTTPRRRLVILHPQYCKSCQICVELCAKQALALDPVTRRVVLVRPEACNGCGLCEFLCPDYVLMMVENE